MTPCEIIDSGVDKLDLYGYIWKGGKIFQIDYDGLGGPCEGMVAQTYASADMGLAAWGCYSILVGADGIDYGTGSQNTQNILAGCLLATDGIAARVCDDYELGPYNDGA